MCLIARIGDCVLYYWSVLLFKRKGYIIYRFRLRINMEKCIYTRKIRTIHMAALMFRFNLAVSTFEWNYKRRILVTKSADGYILENYLDFPPGLFLPSMQKCDSILAGYDEYGIRSEKPYNAHILSPFG